MYLVADPLLDAETGFTIASDLTLSMLPITIIRTLHRPFHEKVLICCLMGAGLGATGAAIARLVLIMNYFGKPLGPKGNAEQDILWGLELSLGVLAASLPTLKSPIHRLLLSWGVLRPRNVSDMSPESFIDHMPNGSHIQRQMSYWESSTRDTNVNPYLPRKDDLDARPYTGSTPGSQQSRLS